MFPFLPPTFFFFLCCMKMVKLSMENSSATIIIATNLRQSICHNFFYYIHLEQERKNIYKMNKKVGMLLQKSTDTRGVGISSMRKSIYLLKTTPSSHTHRFHPLPLATPTSCSPHPLATPIHSTHSPQLSSILLTLHKLKVWMTIVEWVECMGVASGCGEQEVGVASGSGWNLWVWLLGVVLRRYIDFHHTGCISYSSCICTFLQQHPYFFFHLVKIIYQLITQLSMFPFLPPTFFFFLCCMKMVKLSMQ